MKPPNITEGNWVPTDIGVRTEHFIKPSLVNICVALGSDDGRGYPPAKEEEANIRMLAASKKLAEYAHLMQQVAHNMVLAGHGRLLGEWNWKQLAEQGKQVLLQAGYQEEAGS